MPRPGSTANGHESPPSCSTGRHASCLLKNQESPVAIHHWQQDCYTLLCEAVKKVQPSTSADDLKKYSAHSLHVWACVLLDKTGMSPSFIQKSFRWLGGDLFKMYPNDTKAIQDKHLAALQLASANLMALIRTPPDAVVHLTATMSDVDIPSNVVEDNQMGSYIDEMV
jgi:hypothetical protein